MRQARRINDRIRALQRESERLAGEARTLVGDLRKLEIERDLKNEQAKQAAAQTAEAEQALRQTTDRLASLELQRLAQLPDMKQQLVDVYKRGRSGYARLLFGAETCASSRAPRAPSPRWRPSIRSVWRNTAGRSTPFEAERAAFAQRARSSRHAKPSRARRAPRLNAPSPRGRPGCRRSTRAAT